MYVHPIIVHVFATAEVQERCSVCADNEYWMSILLLCIQQPVQIQSYLLWIVFCSTARSLDVCVGLVLIEVWGETTVPVDTRERLALNTIQLDHLALPPTT